MQHVFAKRTTINETDDKIEIKVFFFVCVFLLSLLCSVCSNFELFVLSLSLSQMSIVEIYNEQLSDLLAVNYDKYDRYDHREYKDAPVLTIGEDPKLGVFVRGCQILV
jgi:hypothetical protein